MDAAVIVPPVLRLSTFVLTVIVPPLADGAVPDVAADNVPPFWTMREFEVMLMLPPVPVPSVLVKIPLPVPSTKTD